LKIGKMDASDKEITEAARTANVHSFISKLPNEYLTEVLQYFTTSHGNL
jgi:ATP-binding cassette, subfamily B (MDR/TAP), member 1